MGTPASNPRLYRFGEFTLNALTGELSRNSSRTPLREQPFQLLLALLERPGELVTRDQLVGRLWAPGTFVDFDRGLNKAVNHLREALGDSAENPRFIETLPRKGYRFVAQVDSTERRPQASIDAASPPQSRFRWGLWTAGMVVAAFGVFFIVQHSFRQSTAGTSRISSIAVLPLQNLSRDPEQDYFADGMTDELITNLAKMEGARVTSRASVMRYKDSHKSIPEIGRELNVDAIVEGTVMQAGNRVRIRAQLIQVSTDMHLWAEAYERDIREVLSLQREVATDIARKIDIMFRPLERPQPVNPQAYGLFLKGRYYFYQYSSNGWQQAINYFRQATEVDPNFAQAYSGVADAYLVAGAYGVFPPREALTQGKLAAQKALQLDEHLASAHYALATAYTWYDWDWANAEKEFQRALALNPNDPLGRNWYGGYLSLLGRHDEAIDEHERARQLDPFSLIVNANLARAYYWARRYDEAIAQARKTLALDPKFGVALFWLEGSLRHKSMFREAVNLRQAVHPEVAGELEREFKTTGFPSLMRNSAETFQKGGAWIEAARCYAQIGQKEKALAQLENCYEHRCSSMVTLNAEPDFDVLHGDARFQSLVKRVGLQ